MKPNEKWLHVYSQTDTALDYTPRPSWTARLRMFFSAPEDTHVRLAEVIQRHLLDKEFRRSNEREG